MSMTTIPLDLARRLSALGHGGTFPQLAWVYWYSVPNGVWRLEWAEDCPGAPGEWYPADVLTALEWAETQGWRWSRGTFVWFAHRVNDWSLENGLVGIATAVELLTAIAERIEATGKESLTAQHHGGSDEPDA